MSHEKNEHPSYVFGSAIITIILGSLSFIVALGWNSFVSESFVQFSDKSEELKARFSYAILVTAIAIIIGFFVMYFIGGCKW